MTHDLKIWPAHFSEVVAMRKTCEVRKDDRGFSVGDTLRLREYDPEGLGCYTGHCATVLVTHVLRPSGVPDLNVVLPGHVAMSIRLMSVERRTA